MRLLLINRLFVQPIAAVAPVNNNPVDAVDSSDDSFEEGENADDNDHEAKLEYFAQTAFIGRSNALTVLKSAKEGNRSHQIDSALVGNRSHQIGHAVIDSAVYQVCTIVTPADHPPQEEDRHIPGSSNGSSNSNGNNDGGHMSENSYDDAGHVPDSSYDDAGHVPENSYDDAGHVPENSYDEDNQIAGSSYNFDEHMPGYDVEQIVWSSYADDDEENVRGSSVDSDEFVQL